VSTSVVVPTYRRPDALSLCLDALARQTSLPDEILVVARRDDDATRRSIREGAHDDVRLVLIDVPEGRPGFVAALNAGVSASTGDVVCVTDDDSEPWPDWIARILETFAEDAAIAAVGGRDWVYHGDRLENGAEHTVGTVSWWGKAVGRHHLGVGSARDVAVLKGVNLSVRGDLIRQIGFDRRLRGKTTEHHSELALCLGLLRMGYRVVYDPVIAVDHRPRPRAAETRDFEPTQIRDAAHNETLAMLEHLSLGGKAVHLLWSAAVGSGASPGAARAARSMVKNHEFEWRPLAANFKGRVMALTTFFRTRRDRMTVRNRPHVL
jgi:GT2 family glycosyltransferase